MTRKAIGASKLVEQKEKVLTPKEQLEQIVPSYFEKKTSFDSLKKEVDKENATIKNLMEVGNLEELKLGSLKVTRTVQKRESFDEDLLIEAVKGSKVKGIVKKKEYVDEDALESAIYNGKLDPIILAPARVIKEVVVLKVRKVGKK